MAANEATGADIAPVAAASMQAHYRQSREYLLNNVKLPSDGETKRVPVMQWKVAAECRTELYAYRNPHAYRVCSFTPKFQIEQNSWKVYQNGMIINEKALGAYEEGSYRLYVSNDEDIQVVRKGIVEKERESGIFGGTIRKKDGFTLEITNKSDKTKTLLVTERIPTPATDKIKVRLLSVEGNSYRLLKEGKLQMDVSLPPKSHKRIEVLFEISYDKALHVVY